jgi:beta-glucosidase
MLFFYLGNQVRGNSVADVFSGKESIRKTNHDFPVNYEDTPSAKNWIGTPADDPTSVTYEEGFILVTVTLTL